MAESKSKWFALFVKAHSEKMREFDLNPIKRLADISKCRDAPRASRCDAASCPAIAGIADDPTFGPAIRDDRHAVSNDAERRRVPPT
jgi:hypothetical protein